MFALHTLIENLNLMSQYQTGTFAKRHYKILSCPLKI
jgi:hypothetical protein